MPPSLQEGPQPEQLWYHWYPKLAAGKIASDANPKKKEKWAAPRHTKMHSGNHQQIMGVCALPDSDAARHASIQAKLETTECGAQLLIGEVGSRLAGELLPGLGGAILQGGRGAGLGGGGLLYMGAPIFSTGYLQHLLHT